MNELLDELRGIAARMPCTGEGDCGTATCDKAKLEALIDDVALEFTRKENLQHGILEMLGL